MFFYSAIFSTSFNNNFLDSRHCTDSTHSSTINVSRLANSSTVLYLPFQTRKDRVETIKTAHELFADFFSGHCCREILIFRLIKTNHMHSTLIISKEWNIYFFSSNYFRFGIKTFYTFMCSLHGFDPVF